jgi:hypothetical protein
MGESGREALSHLAAMLVKPDPMDGLVWLFDILTAAPIALRGVPSTDIFNLFHTAITGCPTRDVITTCIRCVKRLRNADGYADNMKNFLTAVDAHRPVIEGNFICRSKLIHLFLHASERDQSLVPWIVGHFGIPFLFLDFDAAAEKLKAKILYLADSYAHRQDKADLPAEFSLIFRCALSNNQLLKHHALSLLPCALRNSSARGPDDPAVIESLFTLFFDAQDPGEVGSLLVALGRHSLNFDHKSLYFNRFLERFDAIWERCSSAARLVHCLAEAFMSVLPCPRYEEDLLHRKRPWNPVREERLADFARLSFSQFVSSSAFDGIVPFLAIYAEYLTITLDPPIVAKLSQLFEGDNTFAPAVACLLLRCDEDHDDLVRLVLQSHRLSGRLDRDLREFVGAKASRIIQNFRQCPETSAGIERLTCLLESGMVLPLRDARMLRDFLFDLIMGRGHPASPILFNLKEMLHVQIETDPPPIEVVPVRGSRPVATVLFAVGERKDFMSEFEELVAAHPEISSLIAPPSPERIAK